MQKIRRSACRACGGGGQAARIPSLHHDSDPHRNRLWMDGPPGVPAVPVDGTGRRGGHRGIRDPADRAGRLHRMRVARCVTHGPDLRVTAVPGVDLRPILGLSGLSAASGPYPGVASSCSADGPRSRRGSRAGPRAARRSTGRYSSAVSGRGAAASWSRRGLRAGSLCAPVAGRVWRPRAERSACRSRVSLPRAVSTGLPVPGAWHMCSRGTCGVLRPHPCTGRRCSCGSQAAIRVRRPGGCNGDYPGPQAVIARSFSDRCLAR